MATRQEWYTSGDDSDNETIGDTKDKMAQTFTLGITGNNLTFAMSSVDIKAFKTGTPSDLSVNIYPTDPAGFPQDDTTAISTGTLLVGDAPGTGQWINIVMSDGTLQANTQYALVLSATGSAGNVYNWRSDGSSATYGGGNLESKASGTWVGGTAVTWDTMFQINGGDYAGTLCTLADAVNKGGANAASGATEEGLVSDFVKQAEGTINAVTRFDWIAAYPNLTDQVKFILNDVASNMAAIYIIAYDMSGFTDRVEAETMINVYREAIARGLSLLRNQEVKSFMVGDTE